VQSGYPYRLPYFFVSLCALLVKMFYRLSAQPASMQHCLPWSTLVTLPGTAGKTDYFTVFVKYLEVLKVH